MNVIIDFFKNLFGIGSTPPPDTSDPCKAPACVAAKNKLDGARNAFNRVCDGLRMLKAIANALQQIVNTPWWIIVALVVIAIIIGGWIAIILFSLVAVYVLAWLLLPVVGLMAKSLAATLLQRQMEFTAALPDVIANCPAQCRGDLSPPQCNLG